MKSSLSENSSNNGEPRPPTTPSWVEPIFWFEVCNASVSMGGEERERGERGDGEGVSPLG